MSIYDWFKERERERIGNDPDFRFTVSVHLLRQGDGQPAADLDRALSYALNVDPSTLTGDERVDVERLRDAWAVQAYEAQLLGKDFGDLLIAYTEAGGSIVNDFNTVEARDAVARILAAHRMLTVMPGRAA